MAEIKLTKSELRIQQNKLAQLQKYLPTLQLKKAMLQLEVNEARVELSQCEKVYEEVHSKVEDYSALVSDRSAINFSKAVHVKKIDRRYENIAGVEVPYFKGITFDDFTYSLFETPAWVDGVLVGLKSLAESQARIEVAREKMDALEKELREVSIRVNLFEKILIPRALGNIRKIKVFLGDLQLAAVSQAKVAKAKIVERKRAKRLASMNQPENAHAS